MNPSAETGASEEVIVRVGGVILHLIEKEGSVRLGSGDLTIVRLREGEQVVAVMARIGEGEGEEIQWPLAKDVSSVKLDECHYFFTIGVEDEVLNYGLTIAGKGQEGVLKELDQVLDKYSRLCLSEENGKMGMNVIRETSPEELELEEKRQLVEDTSAAYWTTLAPNVEDYSGRFARWIAQGSGQMVRGILCCADVTVHSLNSGNHFVKNKLHPAPSQSPISPQALRRIRRVKKLTSMSQKVANGILSGVVNVSGFFASSLVNSKPGKKFFSLLPGEILLASMDGFNKVCDAVEVAGRNVMSTSSHVTTQLVSHKYGEQAARATNEGLDAAGHAIGTAWTVFKIRKALNPKSAIKPTTLAKAAARPNTAQLEPQK